MEVSTKGLLEIAEHEGIVPAPYFDSVGVLTWGIGHTAAAGDPDPAKMSRAMPSDLDAAIDAAIAQFRIDIVRYADRVNDAVTVPLKQHEFDALVSFDFNTGGIFKAQLTKKINAGDPSAADHFMGWLRPPEIRGRRTAEMNLFKTGNYDANGDAIPIYTTDGKGKLGRIIRTMKGSDLLARVLATPLPADLPKLPDLDHLTLVVNEIEAAERLLSTATAKLRPALTGV